MSTPPPPEPPPQPTPGDPLGQESETPTAAAPPPPPPPGGEPRRLTRSRDDRVLGGVAAGIAKYFGIDPVIVRILTVVLVFFGGAGVLLYIAALLLVPNEGEPPPEGPQRNKALVVLGVAALVIVAWPFGLVAAGLAVPLALLVLVALVVAWFGTGSWPARDAGAIARSAAVGLGLLIVLFVVAAGAFWLAAVGGDWVVAALVIAAGIAVLAGAFVRPVRWLVPLAFALAIPAGVVSAANVDLDGGFGEKSYSPSSQAELRDRYDLGAGELVIDLREVPFGPGAKREIDVEVGMGEAIVLVPDNVCVSTRAELGAGEARIFRRTWEGVDVDIDLSPRAGAAPRLFIDADIGFGALRVSTRGANDGWTGYGPFDHDDEPAASRNRNHCASP